MKHFIFSLLFLPCLLRAGWVEAKANPVPQLSSLPGEINASGEKITLEKGRMLFWPKSGPLELKAGNGQTIAVVDLNGKKKSVSGAEAMGLEVEETDLGGSMGKKTYLSGKKKPSGHALDPEALADKPSAQEAGQVKASNLDGIALTEKVFPNGASQWALAWPGVEEKIYWDRRRSMVSDEQSWRQADFQIALTQWADGSYSRHFRKRSGEVLMSFDQNDGSFRFVFKNSAGETVSEIQCQDSCSVAN